MLRHYLIFAVLLAIGFPIAYTLLSSRSQEGAVPDRGASLSAPALNRAPAQPVDAESLAALRHQLQQASQAREQLQDRMAALQIRVEELEHARDNQAAISTATARLSPQAETPPSVRTSVQALIEAGISEGQAAWIQERLDEIDLQQLYLLDRATREGWLNQPRYHKERRQYLNAVTELRDEIDDDTYDRLLYTLGRPNRVVIRDIMQNSAAAQYGLLGGDQVIEYDGQRIFSSSELSSLVTQGSAGVMTLVRVKRDGEIHDIYLPRGPLGIRMNSARLAP